MPVTAKLSRRFYERFGDEITTELVDWFNAVDTTYRSDLRDINELNFARFDAKLEQRFAQQDVKMEQRFAQQDAKWERRFAEQDAKWERRFAEQDAKMEQRFAQQDTKWERRLADLRVDMQKIEARLVRWMFGLWISSTLTLSGLMIALLRSR